MESGDLEARLTAIEQQVHNLDQRLRASAQDAAAARVLAGAADRDVSEFRSELSDFRRATTASFNALREDFTDLGTKMERGFAEIRSKLDGTAAGQQQIVEMLSTMIRDQD